MQNRILLTSRILAILVGVITLLFLVFGLTQNVDLFGLADVVLVLILMGAALIPQPRLACLGMIIGFSYTAGVFTLSVTQTWLQGSPSIASAVGLVICVGCILLLGQKLLKS